MIILCVFGSRSITDYATVEAAIARGLVSLDLSPEAVDTFVDGDAPGVDRLARQWAAQFEHILPDPDPAAWRDLSVPGAIIRTGPFGKYNAKAGHDRNERMAKRCTHFIGIRALGKSRGTDDMIRLVQRTGKPLSVQYL